jgi:uncharacterized protein involved in exopolysaccharide biosynthesis
MSSPESTGGRGFDPEAEQEVDFARYARRLAVRWWVLAAGLVAGAVVGYGISLGGSQVYSASATVYLGQPYSSGGGPLQTLQTNPSSVNAIIESASVLRKVAADCKAKPGDFKQISAHPVTGALTKNGQNPIVKITVEGKRGKGTACVADGLVNTIVAKVGSYSQARIRNFEGRIKTDQKTIDAFNQTLSSTSISTTDKLLFQLQLRNFQEDLLGSTQSLQQVQQVETPKLLTSATAEKVTARSRRNTVVVAALIGLVLGALVALLWDRVAPRLVPRNGE